MPYTYTPGLTDHHFRIADVNDNRVATCYMEENAKLVCELMNRGERCEVGHFRTEWLAEARAMWESRPPDYQEQEQFLWMLRAKELLEAMAGPDEPR